MSDSFTTWRDIVRDFVRKCNETDAEHQADRIREARSLASFSANMPPEQAHSAIEDMLAVDAYESAAIGLLTPGTGFMISRSSEGHFLATVVLAGEERETTAPGKTLALSLLQAHAQAQLDADVDACA